jgi:hypothetical protein
MVPVVKLAHIWRFVAIGIWAHLPPIILIAVFFLASLVFLDSDDARLSFEALGPIKNIVGFLPMFLGVMSFIGLIWFSVTRSRYQNAFSALRWLKGRNWLEIIFLRIPLTMFLLAITVHIMGNFKVNIANFSPYSWDYFFADTDRFLFFGYDPWILTHSVFSHYEATKLIDNFYLIWFVVQQFGLMYIAVLPLRDRVRLTFLIGFCLNWMIGGVILAILLPAAGPVYMEALYGDPMFKPLMDLLRQQSQTVEIEALALQELLWDGFTKPEVEPLGISAFPSLHVAAAVNFACLGFAVHRIAGWVLSIFSGLIFVGSVHLGWHYAVDGIAGVFLAIVFWQISARAARWWLARTEPREAVLAAAA